MNMIKKYSDSHIAFKSIKNKLDNMLGKIQKNNIHKNNQKHTKSY
jgi:hypothetical protein